MKEILSKGAMYKTKKAGGTGNRGGHNKKIALISASAFYFTQIIWFTCGYILYEWYDFTYLS